MGVDPTTHRIYLPTAEYDAPGPVRRAVRRRSRRSRPSRRAVTGEFTLTVYPDSDNTPQSFPKPGDDASLHLFAIRSVSRRFRVCSGVSRQYFRA